MSSRISVQSETDPSKMIDGFNSKTKKLITRPESDDPDYQAIEWEHVFRYLSNANETIQGIKIRIGEI